MRYRTLGRTGWNISEVGFGAWAIGGSWGQVDDDESMRTLHHALDRGVNCRALATPAPQKGAQRTDRPL